MGKTKQIEIEYRCLLDEGKAAQLKKVLSSKATDLGQDDKDVYFFLLPDKIVKTVNNESKGTSEIVAKLNRLGRGSSDFEEIEIDIAPDNFEKAVKIFTNLPFEQVQRSYQKRHNYEYKGVELALKHSEDWGHHLELEIVVDDLAKKESAEKKIKQVADELGVKIMSEEELAEFAKRIDQKKKEQEDGAR